MLNYHQIQFEFEAVQSVKIKKKNLIFLKTKEKIYHYYDIKVPRLNIQLAKHRPN